MHGSCGCRGGFSGGGAFSEFSGGGSCGRVGALVRVGGGGDVDDVRGPGHYCALASGLTEAARHVTQRFVTLVPQVALPVRTRRNLLPSLATRSLTACV